MILIHKSRITDDMEDYGFYNEGTDGDFIKVVQRIEAFKLPLMCDGAKIVKIQKIDADDDVVAPYSHNPGWYVIATHPNFHECADGDVPVTHILKEVDRG